jgi:hypothetical protein
MAAERCPGCGRRPRLPTPARQACDYCDSRWTRTPEGPRGFEPSRQIEWGRAAEATTPRRRVPVTLGTLTDARQLGVALALAEAYGALLGEAVVLLDASEAPSRALPPTTRLHARPLAGHFGAQRSALQRLAQHEWVLQLDTDETLTEGTPDALPGYLEAARRDGVLSLGLTRRNLVDGVLSDRHPDPQYRLCRRTVPYEGQVHERPRLASRARQSRLAAGLAIDHHLTKERVRGRTARYGAMSEGATDTARSADERSLLTQFRP